MNLKTMTKSKKSIQMPENNIVLAIDPGFDRVGIAILKRGKNEEVLYSECIVTSTKQKHEERLSKIGTSIKKIILEWNPQSLAIEKLFFNQNTTSAMKVAEARGVILYEAKLGDLKIFEYSPQDIKIAVTGYGKATKNQVESMVMKLVSLNDDKKKRLDDEIDAIALGITHLAHTRR
jgi:crossover junction endodeoxyribonuclease RuvC